MIASRLGIKEVYPDLKESRDMGLLRRGTSALAVAIQKSLAFFQTESKGRLVLVHPAIRWHGQCGACRRQ